MANTTTIIDARGTPYQTCWGCGKKAGGHEANIYYGNFPFGVEHMDCGQRIESILDRSLRALSKMDENCDRETKEITLRALFTTASRKLDNLTLNKIQDDQNIRSAVENEGMQAALATLRALSKLDDKAWETNLKTHSEVMQGPVLIKKVVSKDESDELAKLLGELSVSIKDRNEKRNAAIGRMHSQLEQFCKECESKENTSPYCILKDVVGPYYKNTDYSDEDLVKLLKLMESQGKWKVLFLGTEIQDSSYKYITHVIVDHVALLPAKTPIAKAEEVWGKTGGHKEGYKAAALPLDCLEWENHWVLIEEIGTRISFGGSEERAKK